MARRSTELSAVDDEGVAIALRVLKERLSAQNLGVDDVAREAGMSRRSLERRFRSAVGRSVVEELRRLRVERVRALLGDTDLPVAEIAERCGFRHANWLATVFRSEVGTLPTNYRRSARQQELPAQGPDRIGG